MLKQPGLYPRFYIYQYYNYRDKIYQCITSQPKTGQNTLVGSLQENPLAVELLYNQLYM